MKSAKQPSALKRFTENAGAVALSLGLVLSLISLYDVLVRKPDADRISAISQFNQAVNSAAKTRQELIQTTQSADPASRLALASMATPRILNDVATARALLPELRLQDVGIPQLLILISESMTAGDLPSAREFVRRAIVKSDAPSFQRAEAQRYNGKVLFTSGDPVAARKAYEEAIGLLGTEPQTAAARAFVLADLIATEFTLGACQFVSQDVDRLGRLLVSQGISAEVRSQLSASLNAQFAQYKNQCSSPTFVPSLG